jgi:CRP-like cAMP-binding protein
VRRSCGLPRATKPWWLSLVSFGRRNDLERAAHFFMELAERLTLNGQATETEFKYPLNQSVIADALGLTAIHVNRVPRQLRERELVTNEARQSSHSRG